MIKELFWDHATNRGVSAMSVRAFA